MKQAITLPLIQYILFLKFTYYYVYHIASAKKKSYNKQYSLRVIQYITANSKCHGAMEGRF